MHKISSFIFWATLILYIVTLLTVSYVGVYLTYFAIPVILISGLIMKFTTPKNNKTSSEFSNATTRFFNDVNSGLEQFNKSLDKFNKKTALIDERTKQLKDQKILLQRQQIEPNINIKYAKSREEAEEHEKLVTDLNLRISEIDDLSNSVQYFPD